MQTNPIMLFAILAIAFLCAAFLASWLTSRPLNAVPLANIGEGFWSGPKTYLSSGALASPNLLVKFGADSAHIVLAGTADTPLGIAIDEASAAEDPVPVKLFGVSTETALGVASEALAAGDLLVPAANGQIRKLPVAAGTYQIIGRALAAASGAGEAISFVPSFPIQRVVT